MSDLRLDGNGALLVAAEQAGFTHALGTAVAEAEAAAAAHIERVLGVLTVRGRDDKTVFVVGDGHHLVHVVDHVLGQAKLLKHGVVAHVVDMLAAVETSVVSLN